MATSAPRATTSSEGEQGWETRAQGTEQLGSVSLQVPCSDVSHMPSLFLSRGIISPRQTQSIGKETRLSLPGGEKGGDTDVTCGAALGWRGPGDRALHLPESMLLPSPSSEEGRTLLCLLQKSPQCGKCWGISQEKVPAQHCWLPSAVGLCSPWGCAGRRPTLAQPQGSVATVNAGSDFPCLRLLVLAAELPWELPERGRLENSPPTASAAGVNASGLLLL